MITLPKEFIATRYPGYFWNAQKKKLYSVKITGTLKPLVFRAPSRWNHGCAGYQVSINGDRRYLTLDYLNKLRPTTSLFPVYPEL